MNHAYDFEYVQEEEIVNSDLYDLLEHLEDPENEDLAAEPDADELYERLENEDYISQWE